MENLQSPDDSSFIRKVRFFSHDYLKSCMYLQGADDPKNTFTKMLYSKLISTSMLLEDFLDYHGAKNNKDWYFYRELSAAIQHLSLAANFQKHLSNRLLFYDLPEYSDFQKEGDVTLDFLTESLINMAPVIVEEARLLNIPIPEDDFQADDFPSTTTMICCTMILTIRTRTFKKGTLLKLPVNFSTSPKILISLNSMNLMMTKNW